MHNINGNYCQVSSKALQRHGSDYLSLEKISKKRLLSGASCNQPKVSIDCANLASASKHLFWVALDNDPKTWASLPPCSYRRTDTKVFHRPFFMTSSNAFPGHKDFRRGCSVPNLVCAVNLFLNPSARTASMKSRLPMLSRKGHTKSLSSDFCFKLCNKGFIHCRKFTLRVTLSSVSPTFDGIEAPSSSDEGDITTDKTDWSDLGPPCVSTEVWKLRPDEHRDATSAAAKGIHPIAFSTPKSAGLSRLTLGKLLEPELVRAPTSWNPWKHVLPGAELTCAQDRFGMLGCCHEGHHWCHILPLKVQVVYPPNCCCV